MFRKTAPAHAGYPLDCMRALRAKPPYFRDHCVHPHDQVRKGRRRYLHIILAFCGHGWKYFALLLIAGSLQILGGFAVFANPIPASTFLTLTLTLTLAFLLI